MDQEEALTEISIMTIRTLHFPRFSKVFGNPVNEHPDIIPE